MRAALGLALAIAVAGCAVERGALGGGQPRDDGGAEVDGGGADGGAPGDAGDATDATDAGGATSPAPNPLASLACYDDSDSD